MAMRPRRSPGCESSALTSRVQKGRKREKYLLALGDRTFSYARSVGSRLEDELVFLAKQVEVFELVDWKSTQRGAQEKAWTTAGSPIKPSKTYRM